MTRTLLFRDSVLYAGTLLLRRRSYLVGESNDNQLASQCRFVAERMTPKSGGCEFAPALVEQVRLNQPFIHRWLMKVGGTLFSMSEAKRG